MRGNVRGRVFHTRQTRARMRNAAAAAQRSLEQKKEKERQKKMPREDEGKTEPGGGREPECEERALGQTPSHTEEGERAPQTRPPPRGDVVSDARKQRKKGWTKKPVARRGRQSAGRMARTAKRGRDCVQAEKAGPPRTRRKAQRREDGGVDVAACAPARGRNGAGTKRHDGKRAGTLGEEPRGAEPGCAFDLPASAKGGEGDRATVGAYPPGCGRRTGGLVACSETEPTVAASLPRVALRAAAPSRSVHRRDASSRSPRLAASASASAPAPPWCPFHPGRARPPPPPTCTSSRPGRRR